MSRFFVAVEKFGRGDEGASIVEYALLVALILVVCLSAMTVLGTKISSFFNSASTTI